MRTMIEALDFAAARARAQRHGLHLAMEYALLVTLAAMVAILAFKAAGAGVATVFAAAAAAI